MRVTNSRIPVAAIRGVGFFDMGDLGEDIGGDLGGDLSGTDLLSGFGLDYNFGDAVSGGGLFSGIGDFAGNLFGDVLRTGAQFGAQYGIQQLFGRGTQVDQQGHVINPGGGGLIPRNVPPPASAPIPWTTLALIGGGVILLTVVLTRKR